MLITIMMIVLKLSVVMLNIIYAFMLSVVYRSIMLNVVLSVVAFLGGKTFE
jgi:hypothetical protein